MAGGVAGGAVECAPPSPIPSTRFVDISTNAGFLRRAVTTIPSESMGSLARLQVRELFHDLRTRIKDQTMDVSYLRRSDARSLAAALVDTILWSNYERVMDTLQVKPPQSQPCSQ
jgi:hypothetical protein